MQKSLITIFVIASSVLFLVLVSCRDSIADKVPVEEKISVLIFSKTNAFRHESIEPGGVALKSYFESRDISITQTEDSSIFNGNHLAPFDVVMFFNTTGNILDSIQ